MNNFESRENETSYQPLIQLDLCAPLFFSKIEDMPSEIGENDEYLLIYELNPEQSRSIEPVRELFLGPMIFTGRKIDLLLADTAQTFVLPAGKYLFTQCRSKRNILQPDEWFDMAIEQQKDGLWERHKLESRLYVRFLFEDGEFVSQLFRGLPGA
ncbi:MAG: hypothetical protein LBQ93_05335 [Treponema sp.]|nr:hypothetical protein [Treponema sp.]